MKGTHSIIAVFNPLNGADKTFTALTFTVGCEISSFTVGGVPGSNPTYDVFTSRAIISLTSLTYTQVPACGYTYTSVYAHTIPGGTAASIIFAGTTVVPSFEIYSTNTAHIADYTLSIANTITVGGSQGQGSTVEFTPTASSFDVTVSNPCLTTTILGITFNPSSITVTDGSTATSEYTVPGDGVDTANSLTDLCGVKSYVITNSGGTTITTWAAITDSTVTTGSKTLTIDPSVYGSHISSTVSETLTITTTFADHNGPSTTSTIAVTINTISCDCSAMAWTAPTAVTATVNVDASGTPTVPAPVSDDSARSSNTAFSACWENSADCATTGTYAASSIVQSDGSALPAWIVWADGGQTLTVSPVLPSVAGVWTLKGTYTPTNGSAAQFDVAVITIACVVTSFTKPSNPSSGLAYDLWNDALAFDFSQTWVQDPACGAAFTDTFTWTGLNAYAV